MAKKNAVKAKKKPTTRAPKKKLLDEPKPPTKTAANRIPTKPSGQTGNNPSSDFWPDGRVTWYWTPLVTKARGWMSHGKCGVGFVENYRKSDVSRIQKRESKKQRLIVYRLSVEDLITFGRAFPGCDSLNPPWEAIEDWLSASGAVFPFDKHTIFAADILIWLRKWPKKMTPAEEQESKSILAKYREAGREREEHNAKYAHKASSAPTNSIEAQNGDGGDRRDAWHEPNDTPPSAYPAGPLFGARKDLVRWIWNKSQSAKGDYRLLNTAIRNGQYWGRVDARCQVSVWFKTKEKFAEANSRKLTEEHRGTS